MRTKLVILFLISLDVVLIGIIIFLISNPKSNIVQSTVQPIPTQKESDIPPLYPGFTWRKLSQDEIDREYLEDPVLILSKPKDGYVSLKLQGWEVVEKITDCEKYSKFSSDFNNYYSNELTKRKWESEYTDNEVKIRTIAAGGVQGSIDGYVKYNTGEIQAILFHEFYKIEEYGCPSSMTFQVFLSEKITLTEIEKRLVEY